MYYTENNYKKSPLIHEKLTDRFLVIFRIIYKREFSQ